MNLIEIKSPAKLNLHLQVLNRRLDGFHNISSLFTLIDITDGMSFKRTDKYIDLVESTPIKDNIVQKAAMLLKENYGVSKGVTINLSKSIPDQKGLGGGSSNAASTLLCLNKLWDLDLTQLELQSLALQLGSDVPFFLYGKTAWAEGRGELLSSFQYRERFFILIFPDEKINTKEAFNSFKIKDDVQLKKENFHDDLSFNSFEKWARNKYSNINSLFRKFESIGKPRLSGTGSTIFIEFDSEDQARLVLKRNPELVFVKSLDRSPLMQIIE